MAEFPELITLPYEQDFAPPAKEDNSDQYPSSLPRYFIENYTKKKQKVFDPFIGFGTTAFVAEDLGRVPYGVEADGERFEWAAGQLEHWQNITNGDAADIVDFDLPKMDLCVTSPPYMMWHDSWNPLYAGDLEHEGYDEYLLRMKDIFRGVRSVMKKNAYVVVHVDNIKHKKGYTPLVRDMSTAISHTLRPAADVVIQWEGAPKGNTLTHCLIFKNL